MQKKKYKEAENLYSLAYNSAMRKLGESHQYTPALLGNVSKSQLEQNKYKKAEENLLQSINLFKKILP